MSQQLEKEAANVLSQMSQLVQPNASQKGCPVTENQPSPSNSSLYGDTEHTYAHNVASPDQQTTANSSTKEDTVSSKPLHYCETCGKGFRKKYNLKTHIRVHTGERPYPCACCDKAFTNASDLVRHSRSHTGEKPYECETCGRCFPEYGSYRRHLRLHNNVNPLRCDLCFKEFSRIDSYKEHLRCHGNEKPFKCQSCGKGFSYKSSFNRHVQSHNSQRKEHACPVCLKRFSRIDYLKVHCRNHGNLLFDLSVYEGRSDEADETTLSTDLTPDNEVAINSDFGPVPILLSLASRGGSLTSHVELRKDVDVSTLSNVPNDISERSTTAESDSANETLIDEISNKTSTCNELLVSSDIEASLIDVSKEETCDNEWRCDPLWMTLKDTIMPLPRFLNDATQSTTDATSYLVHSPKLTSGIQSQAALTSPCLQQPYTESNVVDGTECASSTSIFQCRVEPYPKPVSWHDNPHTNFECTTNSIPPQNSYIDVTSSCPTPECITEYVNSGSHNNELDPNQSEAAICAKQPFDIFPSGIEAGISQEIIVEAYSVYNTDKDEQEV